MRATAVIACLLAGACSHPTIPGTSIRDNAQTRAILDVFNRYKVALEARDVPALIALATPDYSDPGDPTHGIGPVDHAGLQDRLKTDLAKVTGLRLEATLRDLEIKGDEARLDYFQVLRYAVATPSGEKWKSESDDARMRFAKINGEWKIASGL